MTRRRRFRLLRQDSMFPPSATDSEFYASNPQCSSRSQLMTTGNENHIGCSQRCSRFSLLFSSVEARLYHGSVRPRIITFSSLYAIPNAWTLMSCGTLIERLFELRPRGSVHAPVLCRGTIGKYMMPELRMGVRFTPFENIEYSQRAITRSIYSVCFVQALYDSSFPKPCFSTKGGFQKCEGITTRGHIV